ncbi:toll-like receptor 9 [Osmerus mordax]|uniref:toll-like receptor 7 n=1 Tax=Osmerus mordax TaxID=8014 RepID=UPI00350FB87E
MDYVHLLCLCQLLHVVGSIDPSFFPCDNEVNRTHVDCSQRKLSHIPWIQSPFVTLLNLSHTKIQKVRGVSFSGVPNLQELDLRWNCLPGSLRDLGNPLCQMDINKDAFRGLKKLRNLYLSGNSLSSLPWLPTSLEVLDLEYNHLFNISEPLGTPWLQKLFLGKNCHYLNPCNQSFHINERVFNELSNLTKLNLGFNNITSIPLGLPLSLHKLDLRENKISEVGEEAFVGMTKLTSLNLEWNCQRCDHAAQPCFPCLNNNSLKLHRNSLKINNSLLTFLSLRGNSLLTFPEGLFSSLRQLKRLDISDNFLSLAIRNGSFFQELSQLTWLSLIYNYEPKKTFHNLVLSNYLSQITNLEYLLLSGNFFLELSSESLAVLGKLRHLQTLELRMNFIKSSNLSAFGRLPSLRKVDLSQNLLHFLPKCTNNSMYQLPQVSVNQNGYTRVDDLNPPPMVWERREALNGNQIDFYYENAFRELNATLKALDLSNNEFHFLMRGMGHRFGFINNLPSLEVLSLNDNDIGMRIDQALYSISLKYLYFAGNHLNIMWNTGDNYHKFFKNLTNLVYLDISRNQLRSLSQEVICNLPQNLRALRLSDNLLNYFPWENITVLGQLQHFNISKNRLSSLPNVIIPFRSNFTLLDLSYNWISKLPEKFFRKMQGLRYLYLNNNRLKILKHQTLPDLMRHGSNLKTLTLHGNPFACSCDTAWFADFLWASPVYIPLLTTHVQCEFPESLQGTSLLTMDPRSCPEIFGRVYFLSTSFLVLVLTALPLLKHLYGWDLWYCFQLLWAGHKGYSQLPGSDYDDHYDAFVVFDTENQSVRDWVYNELTVHLENGGRRRFRLCLEERDWLPGLSCIENLHNAVYSSAKTVFVLTSGGTGANVSGMIRQVFFMVQQRLLDEKVDVAVLVLLDEVFPKMKYLQLRKRLCSKSVLSWPRNPRAQPLFWNSMRAALSSDNLRSYDSNMSESFM